MSPMRFRVEWSSTTWAGYLACGWALVFAVISFYWAAGGTAGVSTIGEGIAKPALAREPGFVALLWATGILKVIGGLFALALVQPWGRLIPRWVLLTATWGAGVGMIVYGGANMIIFGRMVAGIAPIPAEIGATAVRWYLLLWEPWWLLGGILFALAAWYHQQNTRTKHTEQR